MKLFKSRKSLQEDMLLVVIIMVAVIIVIIMFTYKTTSASKEAADEKICKNSVYQTAMLRFKDISLTNTINCPTRYFTIYDNVAKDQGQIKNKMAMEMYGCAKKFLRGKYELFGDANIYCAVCSVFDFQDKGREINGFGKYLAENNIPGNSMKFIEYLQGYETPKASEYIDMEKLKEKDYLSLPIKTDDKYAVIFVYAKGKDFVNRLADQEKGGKAIVVAGAGVLGGVAGAAGMSLVGIAGLTPPGWFALGVVSVAAGAAAIYTFLSGDVEWRSDFHLVKYDKESLSTLNCKEDVSKAGGKT